MNKKGFTLVEILAVIVILSLVITITATKGFGAFDNTKKAITEQNKKAIEEGAKVLLTEIENCDDDLEDYKELSDILGENYENCSSLKNTYKTGKYISFSKLKDKYIEGNDLNDEKLYNDDNIKIIGSVDTGKIYVDVKFNNSNDESNKENDTLSNKILNNDKIKKNYGVNVDYGDIETEEKGLYLARDNDGFTYYFRGKQSYNYVSFAGQTWRIVRINGDGSIRMILNGNIGKKAYNTFDDVLASVSYVYGDKTSNDASIALTKDNPSNIKQTVDSWYNNKIKSKYNNYIQETIFCNDINYIDDSSNSSLSYDNYEFYYSFGAEQRLNNKSAITPTFKCSENSTLKLKVGLINADEVVFAGGSTKNNNTSYYLYSSSDFWTMSPKTYSKETTYNIIQTYVYRVTSGKLWMTYSDRNVTEWVRPVINLKSNIMVDRGNGTSSNPYVIKTS